MARRTARYAAALVLSACASASAAEPLFLAPLGRYLGWGWNDGYHVPSSECLQPAGCLAPAAFATIPPGEAFSAAPPGPAWHASPSPASGQPIDRVLPAPPAAAPVALPPGNSAGGTTWHVAPPAGTPAHPALRFESHLPESPVAGLRLPPALRRLPPVEPGAP